MHPDPKRTMRMNAASSYLHSTEVHLVEDDSFSANLQRTGRGRQPTHTPQMATWTPGLTESDRLSDRGTVSQVSSSDLTLVPKPPPSLSIGKHSGRPMPSSYFYLRNTADLVHSSTSLTGHAKKLPSLSFDAAHSSLPLSAHSPSSHGCASFFVLRLATRILESFQSTVTVVALGVASTAIIKRQWNFLYLEQTDQTYLLDTSYTSTHELKVRIQLVCFYTLVPLITSAFTIGEIWCLLSNDLAPLYVIIASIFSALIWAMEIGFWTACQTKSNDAVPDLCPVIFKNGKDSLFTLDRTLAPARAAVYLAAVLVVLYAIYASLGIFVFHREHSRAKQRKWIGAQKRASLLKRRSEDEEQGLAVAAAAAAAKREEGFEREATPMLESRASLAQSRGKTVTWE
ncbi:hypothetical protein Q7P36_006163 [Cladosporium allicinum]